MKKSFRILFLAYGLLEMNMDRNARGAFKPSDHYDGKRFFNLEPNARDAKSIFDILKWKLFEKPKPWPDPSKDPTYILKSTEVKLPGDLVVTWINHASILIQWRGVAILTDPIFAEKLGPFGFLNLRRYKPAGLSFEELPPIDFVFLSHNHYDHLDLPTLNLLENRDHPRYIVPLGLGSILSHIPSVRITELDWWEEFSDPVTQLRLILTPAQHWSKRGLFDTNRSLWGGAFLKLQSHSLFFGGDTGYGGHFKQIRERLGSPSVALIPIGAYEPRWFMKSSHLNPDDAVMAHLDLESKQSIAIHFGTFRLSDESMDDPEKELKLALKQRSIPLEYFAIPKNGQRFVFKEENARGGT